MKLIDYKIENGNFILHTDSSKIKITPVTESTIRVVCTQADDFSKRQSLIVESTNPGASFEIAEDNLFLVFKTKKLKIIVCKETCSFSYYDAHDKLLLKEPDKGGKFLTPFDLEKTIFDKNAAISLSQNADGVRIKTEGRKVVDRKAWHYKLSFEFSPDEALYGLGSHEEGMMNLRGHCQYLYQQNMKAVVPMLVSTNGYGILLDNYSLITFHDDIYGSYFYADASEEMDYYFIEGPEIDDIVHGYRKLTGDSPMLPKSAFGYIQSKERYISQQEIIDVASEYRERGVPLDMMVLDWKSWTGELWGQKSFDPERFPDPKAMTDKLHDMNVKLMISVWPIMREGGKNHAEMLKNGCLLGNRATYNAFDPKARELYWEQAKEGLFDYGIDAWWCDCTEPFESDWNGAMKPEPEERVMINTSEAKKYLDPAFINAFSLLHSKGIYEGQRATTNTKRVVNLTRSSYAGQHRYATVTWSGDIAANWQTLKNQIPAGLNFCVTGEPYWSLDIGGFFVKRNTDLWFWNGDYKTGCDDLGYREIYVRFLQLGAFVPMFRSHGTDTPREVWRFGEPGTPFYDAILKFIKLRYSLMPYIYSLAGMVTHNDYTMMRALAFDFRNDKNVYDISDEFMFGPSLLVCPVTEPMYYNSGSEPITNKPFFRTVYLPKGCGWYDFWTGEFIEGGSTINACAPIDKIPLFVKSGSILPLTQKANSTSEAKLEQLRVYPGADGCFTLYEDQGDGYNYEKGKFARIEMRWNNKERILTICKRNGSFEGLETVNKLEIILAENNCGFESPVNVKPVIYDGKEISIAL
jgi:alpha-D-xyloside xylohydrolase